MKKISWLIIGLLAGPLSAASLPDWAKPATTPAALAWKNKASVVELLDETSTTYVRADSILSTERSVLQVNILPEGSAQSMPIFHYNSDTDKIVTLKVWHHTPGGKTRAVDKEFLYDVASMGSQHFWHAYRTVGFAYPANIKAGDLIVYEITYEESAHPVRTQGWGSGGRPLYQGRFTLTPAAGSKLHWYATSPLLQSPTVDQATGTLTWTLEKCAQNTTGRPTAFYAEPISLYVTSSTPEIPFSNWTEVSDSIAKFMEPQAQPGPAVIAKAQAAIAGKVTRWEKIRALVDMIQTEVSYLSMTKGPDVLDGYRPHTAEQCLLNRYGDCKDKATLLVSLLRAIGDQGHVVLLYAGNPTLVSPERPLARFNHAITAIPADDDTPPGWPVAVHPRLGRFVIVDSTTSGNPLGTLPYGDQSGYGLLVMPEGGDLIALPTDVPGGLNGNKTKLTLTLSPSGVGQIHLEDQFQGQAAIRLRNLRQNLARQDLQPALEKRLAEFAPRLEKFKWTENADVAKNTSTLTINCLAPNYAKVAGKDLVLINLPAPHLPPPLDPWITDRKGQSWLPMVDLDTDIVISLPPSLSLSEPIPTLKLQVNEVTATLRGEQIGNEIHLHTTYQQPAGLRTKTDYEALRNLEQKYLQAIKRPMILKERVAPSVTVRD